jgi:hypothetical protein
MLIRHKLNLTRYTKQAEFLLPSTHNILGERLPLAMKAECTMGRWRYTKLLILCYTIRGLRVFENRVLRRIFGPKRDEVTRG